MPFSGSTIYLSEVLGIKNYLCPTNIYSLRSIRGGLPCETLAVVFTTPLPAQEILLKKIMSSVGIFQFSLLETKNLSVLRELIFSANFLADRICLFGGGDLEKETLLSKKGAGLVSPAQKRLKKQTAFLQTCSLEDLEGNSPQIITRKKQLWQKLKKWKSLP